MRKILTLLALVLIATAFKMQTDVADPQQCIEEKCPNEWAACQKDSSCPATLKKCSDKCGTKQSCWEFCLAGHSAAIDVAKCAQKNNCLSQVPTGVAVKGPQECIQQYCKSQEETCHKDRRCIRTLEICHSACNSTHDCWVECLKNQKEENATKFMACASEHHCFDNAKARHHLRKAEKALALFTPQDCIKEHCPDQAKACGQDPSCLRALQDCERQCNDNQTCWTNCVAQKGNTPARNFWKCVLDNDCLNQVEVSTAVAVADPQKCIEEKCPNEWATCTKDPKCPETLKACSDKCGTKQSCWTLCLAGKGQDVIAVAKCAQAQGCDKQKQTATGIAIAGPQECIEQYCKNEQQACEHDPRCIRVIEFCDNRCNTTESCWKDCLEKAKEMNAIHYIKCIADHHCLNSSKKDLHNAEKALALFTPQDCIKEHCPDQAKACGQDPSCLRALQDCERQCNDNQTCWTNCVAQKGNTPASNFWKCVLDNDCLNQVEIISTKAVSLPVDCIKQYCQTEWEACQKDAKCMPALDDCEKKCGSKVSCWSLCLPSKGSEPAINVAKCAQSNGCVTQDTTTSLTVFGTPQDCIKEHCPDQAKACGQDPSCLRALQDCERQCNDNQTCWTNCVAQKGNTPASNFWKCVLDNDCLNQVEVATAVAVADPQQCIEEKCPNEWAACQKDSSCPATLKKCSDKCGTKQSCWEFCLAGHSAAIDVAKCAQKNNCLSQVPTSVAVKGPQECIQQYCKSQEETCHKDRRCIRTLEICHSACNSTHDCWVECLKNQKEENATKFMACASEHHCFDNAKARHHLRKAEKALALFTPQDCIKEHCPDQAKACGQDPSCLRALQDCERQCNDNQTCWTNCVAQKGNTPASNFWKCVLDNDCLNQVEVSTAVAVADPQKCIEEKCPNEWATCTKDPKCPETLKACSDKCGTKQSCWTLCLAGKGQDVIAVAKCAQAQGCDKQKQTATGIAIAGPQECIEQYCKNEQQACEHDPRCIRVIEFCDNRCNTTESCWKDCLEKAKEMNAIHYIKCIADHHCLNSSKKDLHNAEKALALFTPQDCIKEHCPDQAKACGQDPSCLRALQDCERQCNDNQTCWTNCVAQKGNTPASNFWKCVLDNDCLNQVEIISTKAVSLPVDCIKQYCQTEWEACQKDAKCMPALDDCEKKCGSKVSCWSLCLPSKGSEPAINVAKCAQSNGCVTQDTTTSLTVFGTPQDCIKEHCPDQAKACGQDPSCLRALQDCERQCNDNQTCWTNCVAQKGNTPASNFWKCVLDNDCLNQVEVATAVAVADPQQCIEEKCPNEWAACQKDSSCPATLKKCSDKCGTKQSCWEFCLAGHSAAIDVAKCAQKNNCLSQVPTSVAVKGPQECIQQYCKSQEETCHKDRRCIRTLEICHSACNSTHDCWVECLKNQKEENATKFMACASEHHCFDNAKARHHLRKAEKALALFTPQDCIKEHCPDQAKACGQDPSCLRALQDCERQCNDNQTCWTNCVAQKGNTPASNFWKCVLDNDCLNQVEVSTAVAVADPQKCIEEKCPNEWATCTKDPKCPETLKACSDKCGTKQSCWTLCLAGKGQDVIAVAKCAQAQGCDKQKQTALTIHVGDIHSCLVQNCPNQWKSCESDKECVEALHTCEKKCHDKQSCWALCLPGQGSKGANEIAKCADDNDCFNDKVKFVHPFLQCMQKSCMSHQLECLYDKKCSKTLNKCMNKNKKFDFDLECLFAKTSESEVIKSWYQCAGNNFCL